MVNNELNSYTDVRRTVASVDASSNTTWTESLTQLEANTVDVDRLRYYQEDADSTPYVQQRSEHAEAQQSLISVIQPVCYYNSQV